MLGFSPCTIGLASSCNKAQPTLEHTLLSMYLCIYTYILLCLCLSLSLYIYVDVHVLIVYIYTFSVVSILHEKGTQRMFYRTATELYIYIYIYMFLLFL